MKRPPSMGMEQRPLRCPAMSPPSHITVRLDSSKLPAENRRWEKIPDGSDNSMTPKQLFRPAAST